VLLLGMGHYNYQLVKKVKYPHSDEECAFEALKNRRVDARPG